MGCKGSSTDLKATETKSGEIWPRAAIVTVEIPNVSLKSADELLFSSNCSKGSLADFKETMGLSTVTIAALVIR